MPRIDSFDTSDDNSIDSTNTMEEAYSDMMEELIEDVILDLCFKVHRAVKMGYFPVDGYCIKERKFELSQPQSLTSVADEAEHCIGKSDIFGNPERKPKIYLKCLHCNQRIGAERLAPHLNGQRTSGRNASKRIIGMDANSDYDDDDENNGEYDFNKKRSRKKPGKNSKKPAKFKGKNGDALVTSTSDASPVMTNYQEMPYAQRKGYLNQMCGVISKHTKKMCMNTLKCSQHSDEQKRGVRLMLLGGNDMANQAQDDDHIDVDTVDEESNSLRLWEANVSRSPSPTENEMRPSSTGIHGHRQEDRNNFGMSLPRVPPSGYY